MEPERPAESRSQTPPCWMCASSTPSGGAWGRGMSDVPKISVLAHWRWYRYHAAMRLLRLFLCLGCGIGNRDHFVLAGEDQERVLEHKSQQEQISSIPGQDNGNLGRRLSFCLAMCNYT